MLLANTYIGFYFFYGIFGYNCVHKYINNKPIDIISFNPLSYSFICKRMCMLSLLVLLYSAYFINNPSINTLINIILINLVVNVGYYIKWKIDEPTTFYMHIFWGFPAIIYTDYSKIKYIDFSYNNIIYILLFLSYYGYIHKYIYTKRVLGIDYPA